MSGDNKTDILDGKYKKDSLVIGDTEADKETAKRLGCTFIAVTSWLRNGKYLAADRKITALKELYESGN